MSVISCQKHTVLWLIKNCCQAQTDVILHQVPLVADSWQNGNNSQNEESPTPTLHSRLSAHVLSRCQAVGQNQLLALCIAYKLYKTRSPAVVRFQRRGVAGTVAAKVRLLLQISKTYAFNISFLLLF